jgi:hypothetical protein
MKSLLLSLFLSIATCAQAQKLSDTPNLPRNAETGKVSYMAVVEAPGVSKELLKQRGLEWIATNLHSRDGVPPVENKEIGSIIVPLEQHFTVRGIPAGVYITLTLYLKEGRYKYDFTNFTDPGMGPFENEDPAVRMMVGNGMMKKVWNEVRNTTDAEVKALIVSLEHAMTTKAKAASDF